MGHDEILRPRLGVLCVTSGWFRDVGLQKDGTDTTKEVESAARRLVTRLSVGIDPVCGGVVYSPADAEKAAREIRAADVDGILLVPLMWCEDAIPRAALRLLAGLPLLLWSCSPKPRLDQSIPFQTMLRGSGAVCALQLSGMLKREGLPFIPIAGHLEDAEVYAEIVEAARLMAISRLLRSTRIGVLPFPCDLMSTTYVDEFGLRARYGVILRYLELERFRRAARSATREEIAELTRLLAERGVRIVVQESTLEEGIRYALALEKVLAEEHVDALAMNDVIPEMHAAFGLRPCLWNPRLSARGTVVAMEADIAAAVGMRVLRLATGEPPFYSETLGTDWDRNVLLLGHAGYHDASCADPASPVSVIPDEEYRTTDPCSGAAIYFKYRPGPTTIVNCVWDGTALKIMAAEGESLAGAPVLEGNSHLLFRPAIPVGVFHRGAMADGVSQHWLAVAGKRAGMLERLAGILGIHWTALGG